MQSLLTLLSLSVIVLFTIVFIVIEDLKKEIADLKRKSLQSQQPESPPAAPAEPSPAVTRQGNAVEPTPADETAGSTAAARTQAATAAARTQAATAAGTARTSNRLQQTVVTALQQVLQLFWNHGLVVIGSILLVAGISFFGVWLSTQMQPVTRFGLLIATAAGLFGASVLVQEKAGSAAGWLRSAAAAVYLFASLGAGGISGIQFIYNPLGGLLLLGSGILVNLLIVVRHRATIVSALHIALSLTALSVAPQNIIILFAAAITVCAGLSIPIRRRADRQHLIAILLFMAFMVSWAVRAETELAFYNMSALGIILFTGGINIFIHYRKLYSDSRFELLPFLSHLANWSFVIIGVLWFSPVLRLAAVPLGLGGLLLLLLAQHAARLKIAWLHTCDSLIAQMMLFLTAVSLLLLELPGFMIVFILFFEAVIAARIIPRLGSRLLGSISTFFLPIAGLVLLWFQFFQYDHLHSGSLQAEARIFALLTCVAALLIGLLLWKQNTRDSTAAQRVGWAASGVVAGLLLASGTLLALIYFDPSWPLNPAAAALPGFYMLLRARRVHTGRIYSAISAGLYIYAVASSLASIGFILASAQMPALHFGLLFLQQPLIPAILLSIEPLRKNADRNPGLIWLVVVLSIYLPFQLNEFAGSLYSPLTESAGIVWAGFFALLIYVSSRPEIHFKGRRMERRIEQLRPTLLRTAWLPLSLFLLFYLFAAGSSNMIIGGSDPEAIPRLVFLHIPLRYVTAAAGLVAVAFAFLRRKTLPQTGWSNRLVANLPEGSLVFLALVFIQEGSRYSRPLLFSAAALVLLWVSTKQQFELERISYSAIVSSAMASLFIALSAAHITIDVSSPSAGALIVLLALLLQLAFIAYSTHLKGHNHMHYLITVPVFVGMAELFAQGFPASQHSLLMGIAALVVFSTGIILRKTIYRHISSALILVVLIRLLFFELAHAAIFDRAVAFVGMALILLLMNWIHKKYDQSKKSEI